LQDPFSKLSNVERRAPPRFFEEEETKTSSDGVV